VIFGSKTSARKFCQLLFLFFERLRFQYFHLQVLNLLRARQRRVNAFAIGELAALGKDFHAFVIERHPQSSLASLIDSHEAHLL
jgi:hypothetical protein